MRSLKKMMNTANSSQKHLTIWLLKIREASIAQIPKYQWNSFPIKTAMASQGWCREIFRLPLCQLESEEHRSQLLSVVGKMMDDRKEGRI